MIKGLSGGGRYLTVSGGQANTYINNYSGSQGVGNLRYNTSTQVMEVYDGNNWQQLNMNYATVALTSEAENILDWARREREHRLKAEKMAETSVTVADALEKIRIAEEQLKVIVALCDQEEEKQQ